MATKNKVAESSNGHDGEGEAKATCFNCGHYCGGGCCGHGQWAHYLLRWIIGIAIIVIIFCLGMKVGEFKGAYLNGNWQGLRSHRGMMNSYDYDYGYRGAVSRPAIFDTNSPVPVFYPADTSPEEISPAN